MSGRHLGVISIERFLAVERYHQSHPAPSPAPQWTAVPPRRTSAAGPWTAPRARRAGGTPLSG